MYLVITNKLNLFTFNREPTQAELLSNDSIIIRFRKNKIEFYSIYSAEWKEVPEWNTSPQ